MQLILAGSIPVSIKAAVFSIVDATSSIDRSAIDRVIVGGERERGASKEA